MRRTIALMILSITSTGTAGPFDSPIELAIEADHIPGAVVHFQSAHHPPIEAAYGARALLPERVPMTTDTIFDTASLTKVMSTAPAVALLWERGQVDLDQPFIEYFPEFAPTPALRPLFTTKFDTSADTTENRARVTIRQLLTHTSGLPPSISTQTEEWFGHEEGIHRCLTTPLIAEPGTAFRYSDVGFILLGALVEKVSGEGLDKFAQREIFDRLGMIDTHYQPVLSDRIAPTEDLGDAGILRGTVHDPTARRMEGVAGHAGVFSTAADVMKYAAIFLNDGAPLFEKYATAAAMTRNQSAPSNPEQRGLGWDIDSPYAYQRGDTFPLGGFGHTGWTGTSLWIDPPTKSIVVLMSNRNHPTEDGTVKPLREAIGTIAGQLATPAPILSGIDALARDDFAALDGLRIGLITNHTGIDRQRRSTIDLLNEAPNVELTALFSPEHGIRGTLDHAKIDDSQDPQTGLPIYSLYQNETRKPTAEQLADLDALVFDIQDIGTRFYTYIATMGNGMEAAVENSIQFVILDRPNPIGATVVDGPVREGESKFVAWHDIPVQHGMTAGELATMFSAEKPSLATLDLTVIPVENWTRDRLYDDTTGLPWVNPSPNMRNLTQAMLYPGVGLFEFTNISVGRGTDTPFELIGAPWIDDLELTTALERYRLPGLTITPIRFRPDASVYEGELCQGVRFAITNREMLRPIDLGLAIGQALVQLYPEHYEFTKKGNTLLLHPATLDALKTDASLHEIRSNWEPELSDFRERRAKFLRY